jgi:peptidyl-prolyl cis-trans isomerase SurA
MRHLHPLSTLLLLAALAALPSSPAAAQRGARLAAPTQAGPAGGGTHESILAVVNGDVISRSDVDNRGRLFALSTGIPLGPGVLERLRPQILKQLIDERLRLQEIQRRKLVVPDRDIAEAIGEIEQRNGMAPGLLRARLEADGVGYRTLVDQIRVQIGWNRVLRQELGPKAQISDADIADQIRILKAQTGQTEYRLAEIFVPIDDPARTAEAQRFADTVIQQLRAGAPFPVVAAQFSQSQTALQGGDLGWVRLNQIDPEVAAVAQQMPPGAVSNPVQVAGGVDIVQMRGKREVGRDMATMISLRQAFIPFVGELNPSAPTDQQKNALAAAQRVAAAAKGCDSMAEIAKANGSTRPADPGDLRLEGVTSPPLRQILTSLTPGQPSKPIVTTDGAVVLMVCTREQRNVSEPTKDEVSSQLLQQRVELASRQLQRDLRRRAVLDERKSS